jgi:hypothetical protein
VKRKFTKHDSDKSRLDLLPAEAIELVGFVLAHGARKYAPGNWKLCKDPNRYTGAMLRHAMRELAGEDLDPESGVYHLAHAACNALFALEIKLLQKKKKPRRKK